MEEGRRKAKGGQKLACGVDDLRVDGQKLGFCQAGGWRGRGGKREVKRGRAGRRGRGW